MDFALGFFRDFINNEYIFYGFAKYYDKFANVKKTQYGVK